MILQKALELIEGELNKYLKKITRTPASEEGKLTLSHGFSSDGSPQFDSMGMLLVNVEEERIHKAQIPYRKNESGEHEKVNPELRLNLHILFAAHFNHDTEESFKFLGYIIEFFQGKNVFTRSNTPTMDASIEKLIMELQTLTFEQQNHVWGTLGGKYLPSVMYRMRLVVVQQGNLLGPTELVTSVDQYPKMS